MEEKPVKQGTAHPVLFWMLAATVLAGYLGFSVLRRSVLAGCLLMFAGPFLGWLAYLVRPRRRWFRFSLRGLFVLVTMLSVPLGWLGWQYNRVRERKTIRVAIEQAAGDAGFSCTYFPSKGFSNTFSTTQFADLFSVSEIRQMLGDEICWKFEIGKPIEPALVNRAELAFPETEITIWEYPQPEDAAEEELWAYRDSLTRRNSPRNPNVGNVFKTGIIEG